LNHVRKKCKPIKEKVQRRTPFHGEVVWYNRVTTKKIKEEDIHENLIRKFPLKLVIISKMRTRKIHMVKLRNIKDLINSRMRLMNNTEGPKVLINLNGQERKKIHIIKLMEASCGAPNKTTTKMMEKKKII